MMEVIRFQPDEPCELALKYADGKPVEGRFGDQVLFTTVDERVMYLDPFVAEKIKNLRIQRGEPFQICKRTTKKGSKRSVEWEVKRVYPEQKQPDGPIAVLPANGSTRQVSFEQTTSPDHNTTELETQLTRSLIKTQADYALLTSVEAYAKAAKRAAELGLPLTFDHEDVTKYAVTLLIGAQQQGGHR